MTATENQRPKGKPWPFAEAREFLDLGERTFRRMLTGDRPAVKSFKLGGKVYIPDSEVSRLATEGTR